MVECIIIALFVLTVCLLSLRAKRFLYIDEHVASIGNELETFNKNFKSIEEIDEISDFKIGSSHLYE